MLKFLKLFLIASGFTIGSLGGAQAQTRFIVVSHGAANDPYHSVVKNGFFQAAKDLGVSVDYRAPDTFDMVKMRQLIEAAIAQKPDGLIVTIPDASALGEPIKRAIAAGIPVISYNAGIAASKSLGVLVHVGQDEYEAGKLAGEALKNLGGKNAICLNHEVGNVTQDMRCRGLSDGFGKPALVVPGKADPSENYAKVKAILGSDPTVDSIFCTSTVLCAEPAVKAVKESGAKVKVGSTSLSTSFLKMIESGDAGFATDQQQYMQGYLPVVLMYNYVRYQLVPPFPIITGPRIITKDNVGRLAELAAQGIR